jgi:2-haloacid dehalogenase
MSRPRVVAFDVFGTVFDLSSIDRQEVRDYVQHIRQEPWRPLQLPAHWERLPAYPDAAEGIERLRKNFVVVTCSNGPLGLLAKLSKHNGILWDAIIPLELNRVYKPKPRAYLTVCEVLNVQPADVLMVTANRTFGDLEASRGLGMAAQLIRDGDGPKTIIALAESLEAVK